MLGKRSPTKLSSNKKGRLAVSGWRSLGKWLALATLVCLPLGVEASTLHVPRNVTASGSSATFSISWNCSESYCVVGERVDGNWRSVASGGSSSTSVTKSVGRYSYRLRSCTVTGSRYGTTTECTTGSSQTVTVSGPLGQPAERVNLFRTLSQKLMYI